MPHFDYMAWAKQRPPISLDMARSGVMQVQRRDLDIDFSSLEINGRNADGYDDLRRAIGERYRVEAHRVVLTQGASFANHLVYAALLDGGGEAVVEEPAYEVLYKLPLLFHATVKRLPRRFEDGFQVDPAVLRQCVSDRTRLIVLTNLHNPSGVKLDESVFVSIGEIAAQVDARVLVDEVYLESLYERRPPVAARLGSRFITTSSLTKAYGLSGLRCGWIIADADLAAQLRRLNDFFGVIGVFMAEQLGALVVRRLDALALLHRPYLTENLEVLTEFMESSPELEWVRPAGGMVAFPRLTEPFDTGALARRLNERYETAIAPGAFFERPRHFRLAWGLPSELFREGLRRLRRTLGELRRKA